MKAIVDGIATEYQDTGSGGTAVVFLHGWMTDLYTFDAIMPVLQPGRRIIRLDLPGFGGTETPRTAWHVSDYASFVSRFLQKIDVKEYELVGHSFGCRVALKGIADGTLMPSKLALIGAAGVSHAKSARSLAFMAAAKIGKTLAAVIPSASLKSSLKGRLYGAAKSDYLGAGALKDTYLNAIREDLSEAARAVRCPTLLIWGSEDDQAPLEDGRRFQKLIPDARLEVIGGEGHFVHIEAAEGVGRLLNSFL